MAANKPAAKRAAKPAASSRRRPAAKPTPAQAAAAEVAPDKDAKTVAYEGLTLTLPDELPAAVLMQVVEMEATSDDNPVPLLRILRKLLGGEQYAQVTHHVPDEGDWASVYGLLRGCLNQYGLALGE